MGKKKKSSRKDTKPKKKIPNINDLEEADTAIIDFDKLVNNEYQRLLRTYRVMEDERHSVTAKGNALSKQAVMLDRLCEEVRDIKTDLYNVDSVKSQAADTVSRLTILQLLEGYDKANEEQEFCLRNIRELSVHVDRIIQYLVEHRIKVQGIFGNSKTPAQMEKRRRILENRLYFYTTKYCLKINENKVIRRDEINLSLKLRGLFHSRLMALKRQLQETKVKMGDVVFLATTSYDQRDELIATIRLVRERNDKESRSHVLEMKEFNRVIFNDTLVRGFLRQKLCARNIYETEKQRGTRKNQNKLNHLNHQLGMYTRSFKTILSKSKFTSMEGLISSYNETMQQNFASFRSNCDLNHEIVFLRDETLKLSTEIEFQYEEYSQRQLRNEAEQGRVQKATVRHQVDLDQLDESLAKSEGNMTELLKLLDPLFTLVGCSYKSLAHFLGNTDKIKPRNAIMTMQLIESRIQELLLQEHHLETRRDVEILQQVVKKEQRKVEGGPKGKQMGGPFLPTVVVSSIVEEGDEEDDDRLTLHPLPEKEIREVILERMRHKNTRGFGTTMDRESTISRLSTAAGSTTMSSRRKTNNHVPLPTPPQQPPPPPKATTPPPPTTPAEGDDPQPEDE